MPDRVGQQFGNYRLVRLLGQGGFADVYLARHIHLETQVAIKVLSVRLTSEGVENFRTEARTVAHLVHPHIIRVFDFGVEDNTPYLAMDYAPNGSLRRSYPTGTRLPLDTIVKYVKQIAEALQYAHEKKLIHRDVKPENMLLDENHQVLLSDFGIATVAHSTRSLHTQEGAGTIYYMAPEQIQGKPRLASDQYALGVVVYEWLSGVRPFTGTAAEIGMQHLLTPPPSIHEKVPTIPLNVEQVVLTALAKDPQQRFASVQTFAAALERAFQQASSSPVIPSAEITPATRLSSPADRVASISQNQFPLSTDGVTLARKPSPPAKTVTPQSLSENNPVAANSSYTSAVLAPSTRESELSQISQQPQRSISRRTALIGITGGLAVVGGGITWLVLGLAQSSPKSIYRTRSTPFPTSTPSPASTPATSTHVSLGNTLLTYHGHHGAVYSAQYSPDGTRIASGSYDGTVQVWNAADGSPIYTYHGHPVGVSTAVWSPDGTRIASGSAVISGGDDHTVQVWNAIDGGNVFTYKGHSAAVRAVAWHGTRIASASDDGTVQVWNAIDGSNAITYRGHSGPVKAVAWSSDGRYIASGGGYGDVIGDATVQVWDANTRNHLFTYKGHVHPLNINNGVESYGVNAVAWNGSRIASASWDTTVQVWNAFDGSNVLTYHGHSNGVFAVAWSPNGKHIVSASGDDGNFSKPDNTVQIWQASNGEPIYTYRGHGAWVHTAAWSPDGTHIVSGGEDSLVKIWQAS